MFKPQLPMPETFGRQLPEHFPLLKAAPPAPPRCDLRRVVFGLSDSGTPITMGEKPRFEHSHIIGTTGGGKTNLAEHMVRQDIKRGDGVCYVDPHGSHPDSVYRSLLTWLNSSGHIRKRKVHLLDANFPSYTTGFNPLALPDEDTSVSVVAGVALEAIERAWGDEDTHTKPTIRRLLKAAFAALAELELTLSEAELLFDYRDRAGVRAFALSRLRDRYARDVLADLELLSQTDRNGLRFRDEVVGPLNRLAEFLSAPAIRRIVGQRDHCLDLRTCLDEGHIILVNLSGGNLVHDADNELLGRLLTRFLFFHAKRRRTAKPFWFYLDECQRYLSGDIPSLLAEARKFRVGVILSHQWQSQLSKSDEETLAAVHNATNLKVAFRIKHPKEAKEIAEAVMPLNLEQPVQTLLKPTVIGNRRTWFASHSTSEQESTTRTVGESFSESSSSTIADSVTESISDSYSEATSSSEAESHTNSRSKGLSNSAGTSVGQSLSRADQFDAPTNIFNQPVRSNLTGVALTRGSQRGRMDTSAETVGTGSSDARSTGTSNNAGSAHAASISVGRSEATTRGETYTQSESFSASAGTSQTKGASEGLEPVYAELPSAVHSYENILYFGAVLLRSLPTGHAFINFVDSEGMKAARVVVPRVMQVTVPDVTFLKLCESVLEQSPFALPSDKAREHLERREQQLLLEAERAQLAEVDLLEPTSYRVPALPAPRPKGKKSRGTI